MCSRSSSVGGVRYWLERLQTEGMVEALKLVARTEGILLDPVYSGKGMAGLVDLIRGGQLREHRNIVFLHTGGSVGLFGYPRAFRSGDQRV